MLVMEFTQFFDRQANLPSRGELDTSLRGSFLKALSTGLTPTSLRSELLPSVVFAACPNCKSTDINRGE